MDKKDSLSGSQKPLPVKPTIAQLEQLLQNDEHGFSIMPDGTIVATEGTTEPKPLTFKENLGGEYGHANQS